MSAPLHRIVACRDPRDQAVHVAAAFAGAARAAVAARGRFVVAWSPAAISDALIEALLTRRDDPFWGATHIFWSDTFSSAGAGGALHAARTLLARLPLRRTGRHLDSAERPSPIAGAMAVEQEMRAFFGLRADALPAFDLALLGLSANGRVAGLTASSRALGEISRLAVADFAPDDGRRYVTLTAPVLDQARRIVVIASPDAAEIPAPGKRGARSAAPLVFRGAREDSTVFVIRRSTPSQQPFRHACTCLARPLGPGSGDRR